MTVHNHRLKVEEEPTPKTSCNSTKMKYYKYKSV
jgi:hypothetical protein